MIERIYIEREVEDHPRTVDICRRFPKAVRISCERYGEVFNRKAQSFRLQKRQPALVLAKKHGATVLPAPAGYGIGSEENYYFSHMLNCLYDCRYCFLQGMFRSAHYLHFVNYEDFQSGIDEVLAASPRAHFFSGYDCDSLALEPVTGFAREFLPFFRQRPKALVELRTKSVQVKPLLEVEPLANAVVAYSFTPAEIAEALEHKAPPVERRIQALEKLQERGWRLGLRFDPVIYHPQYQEQYGRLFQSIFQRLDSHRLHSVSLGPFRLPDSFFRSMVREFPDEALLAGPLVSRQGRVSYGEELEQEMLGFIGSELKNYIDPEIFFPCVEAPAACQGAGQ